MKRLQRKDGHSSLWCSAMGCFLYSQAASRDSGCIWELESQPQTVALPEPHIFTRSKCTQQCSGAWVERLWQQLCDYSKVLVVSLFHVSSPLVNKNIHLRVWVGKIDKYLWSTTVCLCECSKDCSMCLCVFAHVVTCIWNCQILPVMNASSSIPTIFCFSFHAFSSKLFLSFCGKCPFD